MFSTVASQVLRLPTAADGSMWPGAGCIARCPVSIGQTVSEHTNGKGFVIQLSEEMYHAYTYVTDKDLQKLEITYTADGKTETKTCDSYPFEFIIRVDDVNSDFQYNLKATMTDGTVKDMGSGVLRTLDNSVGVDPDAGVVVTSGSQKIG